MSARLNELIMQFIYLQSLSITILLFLYLCLGADMSNEYERFICLNVDFD